MLKLYDKFDVFVGRVIDIAVTVTGCAMVGAVTTEVVYRYVFNQSLPLMNGLARYSLVWFFMLGAAVALRRGQHIGFDLLLRSVSKQKRYVMLLVVYACSAFFFVLLLWGGIQALPSAFRQVESSLGIRAGWLMLSVPVGSALMLQYTVGSLFRFLADPDQAEEAAAAVAGESL